jgi:hypothetical protein
MLGRSDHNLLNLTGQRERRLSFTHNVASRRLSISASQWELQNLSDVSIYGVMRSP